MKPKLLDLFCCAGGATKGYQRAGFYVVGVDSKPQPHYCGDEFYQADALEFLLEGYDAYHASPPCQDYSLALKHLSGQYPRLIDAVEARFEGKLWIIENVPGSPIPNSPTLFGDNGLMLCGTMFGLKRIRRHRLFLCSIRIPRPPRDCTHREYALNPYNADARKRDGIQHNALGHFATAMGIDWMRGEEIGEAIPPAYTEYIGKYLLQVIEVNASRS